MREEEIKDKIDNADKKTLEEMTKDSVWKEIMEKKELLEYYNLSMRLKDVVPEIDLWDRFRDRLEQRDKKRFVLRRWVGAAAVAVLLVTAGLIFFSGTPTEKYEYAHLLEGERNNRQLQLNEHEISEYREQQVSDLDYYYEIATL